jgi:general secretion pathway protein G
MHWSVACDNNDSGPNPRKHRKWQFSLLTFLLVASVASLLGSGYAVWQTHIQNRKALAQYVLLKQVALGVEAFRHDNGRLPSEEEGISALVTPSSTRDDPRPYLDLDCESDIWGNDVLYRVIGPEGNDFDLLSLGRNGINEAGAGDDISLQRDYDREAYNDYAAICWNVVVVLFFVLFFVFVLYAFREF